MLASQEDHKEERVHSWFTVLKAEHRHHLVIWVTAEQTLAQFVVQNILIPGDISQTQFRPDYYYFFF